MRTDRHAEAEGTDEVGLFVCGSEAGEGEGRAGRLTLHGPQKRCTKAGHTGGPQLRGHKKVWSVSRETDHTSGPPVEGALKSRGGVRRVSGAA